LNNFNWDPLCRGSAEDSLTFFLEVLWLLLTKYIPRKITHVKKSSHPWLNQKCKDAIAKKNDAEGSEQFVDARKKCLDVIKSERASYVKDLKEKISTLPRNGKQWWRLNRELLNRKAGVASIPTLREETQWLTDSKEKADAFARKFSSKSQLPAETVDCPFFGVPDCEFDEFVAFRSRTTKRLLKKLNERKATGHDMISAAILKKLHACIAVPFTRVARRLFYEGCWPRVWQYHISVQMLEGGAAFIPGNYRGMHLVIILSKIAERMIGFYLVP